MANLSNYMRDFTGVVFGRLTVRSFIGRTPSGKPVWVATCDCGSEDVVVMANDLATGDTKSCGCLRKETVSAKNKSKRGVTTLPGLRPREYASWISAKRRCLVDTDKDYKRYGGAGVTFFTAWSDSFESFYDYMGDRPHGTTLDRIDNAKGYEPGNVRWATSKQQALNRSVTRWHYINGKQVSTQEAARLFGVTECAILKAANRLGGLDGYNPRRARKSAGESLAKEKRGVVFHASV